MKNRIWPFVALFVTLSLCTIVFGSLFFRSPQFLLFQQWVGTHFILFLVIIFIVKVIGIIWPPIPGGLLSFGAVPIIGWEWAFFVDFLGNLVGSTFAYFLARRYGGVFVKKIFPEKSLAQIQSIKILKKHEMEAVFLLSLVTGVVMAEVASYSFGMMNVRSRNFLVGNSTAHIVRNAPLFIWFDTLSGRGSVYLTVLLAAIAVPLLIIARKRYFEVIKN